MPINTGSFSFIAIGLGNWFLLFFGFADFFFAIFDESVCLDVEAGIDGGLTLKTWLLVDGLVRVGLGCLTGIVLVSNYQQDRWGAIWVLLSIALSVGYFIFLIVWVVEGSLLFWGDLPEQNCGYLLKAFVSINLVVCIAAVAICVLSVFAVARKWFFYILLPFHLLLKYLWGKKGLALNRKIVFSRCTLVFRRKWKQFFIHNMLIVLIIVLITHSLMG